MSTKGSPDIQNQYLDFLINTSFQGVNALFVLSFENKHDRKVHIRYYHPKVDLRDCNIILDDKKFFHQPVRKDMKTYDNIHKTN